MNTFGRAFRITTFGESHGPALGVVIDGCPPGIQLDLVAIQAELDRRRPGTSKLVSARKEPDRIEWLSGLLDGRTLGTPIAGIVRSDADPAAYEDLRQTYRPSHADFAFDAKYGLRAWAGGGRASARETVSRVAAGAVARQVLATLGPVEVVAWVDRVGELAAANVDAEHVTAAGVDESAVRCPDPTASAAFEARIAAVRKAGDTVGGVVRAVARGVPAGLGEPVFDKLDADLAKAMISLPAAKGFESGSGYDGSRLTGLAHNDAYVPTADSSIGLATNRSGGIQGGISVGAPIAISVAFKPVATVFHDQQTVDSSGRPTVLRMRGRHDPCVLPRAVPLVEAMMCLVLLDHWLRWRGQVGAPPPIPREKP